MEISFKEKRILVTGAGQGIGRGIAVQLAKCGAKVVALGRQKKHLDSLQDEVPGIETICVDIQNWNETRNSLKTLGHVDCLVNNAAVAQLSPFLEIKPEEFDQSFSVNVKAVINISQYIARDWLHTSTPGVIVNLSSQASQAALKDHAVYCATKSALDSLTRVMALELGPHNIRVNCVNPTVIMTEMGKLGWSDPAKAEPMKAKIPLGRFGEVHEVVDAVLFLLSDRSSMITGVALPVDGGFLAA
ncbi:uncharacterized protein CBL_08996 [Carabus blaptoides fortunei]